LVTASVREGEITIDTLGTNEAMLAGNLVAILSSALIHFLYSTFIDPQDFDFSTLDAKLTLVEEDMRGLTEEEQDPRMLEKAERWIARRGYVLTVLLIFVWPILSVPAGVFSRAYFAFWVLLAIAWGFGAAIVIAVLPLVESSTEINKVLGGMVNACLGRKPGDLAEEEKAAEKEEILKEEPKAETAFEEENA
jgi:hypothetical protein